MWHSRNHEESKDYRHCAGRGGHFRGGFGRFGHGRGHGHDGGGFGRRRGLYDSDELRLVLLYLRGQHPREVVHVARERLIERAFEQVALVERPDRCPALLRPSRHQARDT